MLGLFLDPEYGDDIFLRNVRRLSADYTALYARIYVITTAVRTSNPTE
jgi:hypothetical protein